MVTGTCAEPDIVSIIGGCIPGPRRHRLTRLRTVMTMESPAERSRPQVPVIAVRSASAHHPSPAQSPTSAETTVPGEIIQRWMGLDAPSSVSPNWPLTNAPLHRQSRSTPSPVSSPRQAC